jgi:hypothetical protein
MSANHITADDLAALGHLLPYSAMELVQGLGVDGALALLNGLPGVVIKVPLSHTSSRLHAKRWAQIVAVVGENTMARLVALRGGQLLEVPTCHQLRMERRNRWIRARFDAMTGTAAGDEPMTRTAAIYELGRELAAAGQVITYRGLEQVIDSNGPALAASRQAQRTLFD